MKTTLLLTALVAILGFTWTSTPVNAQTNSTTPSTSAPASDTSAATTPSDTKFHGTVSAIDATAKTLTVKGKGGDLALSITDATQGGDLLSSLAVGDKVGGSYTTDSSGKMTATELKKSKGKKSGGKGAKAGGSSGSDTTPPAE